MYEPIPANPRTAQYRRQYNEFQVGTCAKRSRHPPPQTKKFRQNEL